MRKWQAHTKTVVVMSQPSTCSLHLFASKEYLMHNFIHLSRSKQIFFASLSTLLIGSGVMLLLNTR